MEQLGSHWTDFHKIWYLGTFFKILRKFNFLTWQEYRVLYMKTNIHFWSHLAQFFLKRETFQTKVVEKIKTHFMLKIYFENRAVYDVTWKNTVELDRPQMTNQRTRIACWVTKDTYVYTRWKHVILIAFPLQQLLHEHASILRYTYIACLVSLKIVVDSNAVPRNLNCL
jgi:hypothetical protein